MSHNKEEPSRILKYLYLGGKVHAKDKDLLQKLNITHVVNCSPSRSVDKNFGIPNYFKKDGDITYLRIPIFDNKGEDITPYLDAVYNFIRHGKHYGNILVHCLRGVSRSTSFVMGYLMRDNEMTVDEALQHVKSYRSIVQPNGTFLAQLRQYEENLLVERQESVSESPQQQQVQVQPQQQVQVQPDTSSTTTTTATVTDVLSRPKPETGPETGPERVGIPSGAGVSECKATANDGDDSEVVTEAKIENTKDNSEDEDNDLSSSSKKRKLDASIIA